MTGDSIFLYGPSGSGKTTTGKLLAANLGYLFFDLDVEIEQHSGCTIAEIFAQQGEAAFRQMEQEAITALLADQPAVVALGGGALTTPAVRALVEANGKVVCLRAAPEVLLARLQEDPVQRPLIAAPGQRGEAAARLADLLARRADHYASFTLRLDTTQLDPQQVAWQIQILLGRFCVQHGGPPYPVAVQPGGLDMVGELIARQGLRGPFALVADSHTGPLYADRVTASLERVGYPARVIRIPAGEASKTIDSAQVLWNAFLDAGLERGSTAIALGGGVIGDLTGFAAAAYLRGIRWVNLPTTLLAMVDSSLGGKTGVDIPRGKNLVGAFHPPALVLADPQTLASLPEAEFRSGMAEAVKHAIIGDPGLLEVCTAQDRHEIHFQQLVARAMAVKVNVIEIDPFEKGVRAALNYGHTIGHAVEQVSGYQLRHGEAVAIGMVVEACLAERLGLAETGLAQEVTGVLTELSLPVNIPAGLDRTAISNAMNLDKKKAGGRVRFALPVRLGRVQTGVDVPDEMLAESLYREAG